MWKSSAGMITPFWSSWTEISVLRITHFSMMNPLEEKVHACKNNWCKYI
jgi:hypothetical protein